MSEQPTLSAKPVQANHRPMQSPFLRRGPRRWLLRAGVLGAAGYAGLLLAAYPAYKRQAVPESFLLELDMEGLTITEAPRLPQVPTFDPSRRQEVQLSKVLNALKHAESDPRVKGIVAIMGTTAPSAGLAQVQELRHAVSQFRQNTKDSKPTLAHAEAFGEAGLNGTASYWLASAFSKVHMMETGLCSFTGLATQNVFFRKLLDKWRVVGHFFAREEYKSIIVPYRDTRLDDHNREANSTLLRDFMSQIVADVAVSRGLTTTQVSHALDHGPLLSGEAQDLGLIDACSHRHDSLKALQQDAARQSLQSGDPAATKAASVPSKAAVTAQSSMDAAMQSVQPGDAAATTANSIVKAQSNEHAAKQSAQPGEPAAAGQTTAIKLPVKAYVTAESSTDVAVQGTADDTTAGLLANDKAPAGSAADDGYVDVKFGLDRNGKLTATSPVADLDADQKAAAREAGARLAARVQGRQKASGDSVNSPPTKRVSITRYIRNVERKQRVEFTKAQQELKKTQDQQSDCSGPPLIAVITASGAIVAGQGSAGGFPPGSGHEIASTPLCRALLKAGAEKQVKAVVLRIDSPGGSAVASDAIHREVKRLRDSGTPVVVSMGNVAASGGYYISAPANLIVAQPTTITGSIGVVNAKFNISKTLEDQGITTDGVKVGANADAQSPFQDFTKDQQRQVNHIVDEIYYHFMHKVADGRGMPMEAVRERARGRVWSGQRAHELGLVDVLGGLQDAVEAAKQLAGLPSTEQAPHAVQVMDFPPPKTAFQMIKGILDDSEDSNSDIPVSGTSSHVAVALASWLHAHNSDRLVANLILQTLSSHEPHRGAVAMARRLAEQHSGIQMRCNVPDIF